MSRVDKKEKEKKERQEKKYTLYRYLLIVFIMLMVFSGIMIVDEATRSMLMTEEPRAFGYKKINTTLHEMYFFGLKIYVDEIQMREQYLRGKNDVQNLWHQFKALATQHIADNL